MNWFHCSLKELSTASGAKVGDEGVDDGGIDGVSISCFRSLRRRWAPNAACSSRSATLASVVDRDFKVPTVIMK